MNIESVDPGLVGLNPPQREAVLHEGGPLVVFAGAGSGKTRVITHRVAHLVTERGVAPRNVLAVTFTNKAASQLKGRLERLIGRRATRELWVGTFHATCARLLRRYASEIGIRRDFSIYDEQDSRAMIKRCLRDLDLDDKRWAPKMIANRISREKQEVRGPSQMVVGSVFDEPIQRVYEKYDERMRAANALDFADLIYRLVLAVESDEELRAELTRRFRHLLVDEFQDTNHVQYRLVRALAAAHRNITVVGDDDQSIYRWRGADRRNILNFRHEFSDTRVIKLEQNYRSTQRILRAANAVISRALDREPKELWTMNQEGPRITIATCEDERREAELVVQAVRELQEAGRSLEEIALFYRIHAQSRVFEEELRRTDVPYRIVGGMRFYERAEIKDILAYLRVVANPSDDVSLLRILNVPARGIGKKSVEGLLDRAAREGGGVWDAVRGAAGEGGRSAKRLKEFVRLMDGFMQQHADGGLLAALAHAVFSDSGYEEWLVDQDSPQADARQQNIAELLTAIELAQEEDAELDLATFLEHVTLETDRDDDEAQEKLTLMTVHAAKGLEFPVVVVAGLEEGTFPFKRASAAGLDREEIEEERRLAYVALTRAKERVLLTWAETRRLYGRDLRVMSPSRFLDELPADDVSWSRSPRRASPPAGRGSFGGGPPAPAPRRVVPGDSFVDRTEGVDIPGGEIHVGMSVRHSRFGLGTIIEINPAVPPRVKVEFGNEDTRTIRVDYLQPA